MSLQTFLEVAAICVIIVGGQGAFFYWLLRRPEREGEPQQPTLRFIDRPLCAVDKTPITEPFPVQVQMVVELMRGISLPVTIYICQHCVEAVSSLVPVSQGG